MSDKRTTVRQRVESLTEQHPEFRSTEIAAKVGCDAAYVRSIWAWNKRQGRRRSMLKVYLSREYMDWICAEAEKIKADPGDLALAILNDGIAEAMAAQ